MHTEGACKRYRKPDAYKLRKQRERLLLNLRRGLKDRHGCAD